MDAETRRELDDLARVNERHGRTLYGNGQLGVTTRLAQMEQSVQAVTKLLDDHRADRKAAYAMIITNGAVIVAAVAAALIGLLR